MVHLLAGCMPNHKKIKGLKVFAFPILNYCIWPAALGFLF